MNLELSYKEAVDGDKIIEISDSQELEWIDILNKVDREINAQKLKEAQISIKKKHHIKDNLKIIHEIQFVPEFISIVFDTPKQMFKLEKGFTVNGVKYERLLGTPGGLKNSTVIYTSKKAEITALIDNGRNLDVPLVPAKFEAYKALTFSGSNKVSNTDRVLVVHDLVTHFDEDVIVLDDADGDEPTMTECRMTLELDESDGYGLISPALAQIWSNDLGLDYMMSGCCIRNAFVKGMVGTFDFVEFAKRYGQSFMVTDVWGQQRDIRNIDIIITTSMLKLWKSYSSIDNYLSNCHMNNYSFRVTKVCPKQLDKVRTLNYQFIQSYELSNEEIGQLIEPTVDEIKDILGRDINKTLLYVRGENVDENNCGVINDWTKALMIDDRMINDPYVIDRINTLVTKKIQDAKIGIVKVHGNYSIILGDPFALCQKIFNVDVGDDGYGLLKKGEVYNKFWSGKDVVCFRAPMSNMNNIRKMHVADNDDMAYWYQYMPTMTLLNCHDSFCHALNGCDKDKLITSSL